MGVGPVGPVGDDFGPEDWKVLQTRGTVIDDVEAGAPGMVGNGAYRLTVADRIYVLRLGREAGDFKTSEANEDQVVSAITGLGDGSRGVKADAAALVEPESTAEGEAKS